MSGVSIEEFNHLQNALEMLKNENYELQEKEKRYLQGTVQVM